MNNNKFNKLQDQCVRFAQRLIQTPSMSGEEARIAGVISNEMTELNFDEVWQDGAGNICGRIFGRDRSLGALVLNTHLDHVDPGELDRWSVDPYSAVIQGDRILGRGACDIKGPMAVQIYAMAALKRFSVVPKRDIVFTGVVQEEVGGAGAKYWIDHLNYPVELVILGEPSENNLSLGHRGILQITIKFPGKSRHASAPDDGSNPNYAVATFLNRIRKHQAELSSHPLLGSTTVAPTILEVDTRSLNVTPAWTRVVLDFRSGSESGSSLRRFIHQVAGDLDFSIEPTLEIEGESEILESGEPLAGYFTPPEQPVVQTVKDLVTGGMGWEPALSSYRFATDGRHFTKHDMAIIGYAPGEESLAHTADESISIPMMADSLRGYVNLLRNF
jgi:succinyl-diaminopimelate desuccinylase